MLKLKVYKDLLKYFIMKLNDRKIMIIFLLKRDIFTL